MTNGCCGRRGRRRRPVGCLNSVGGLRPWGPIWNGGCPDANGCYEADMPMPEYARGGGWDDRCGNRCQDRCGNRRQDSCCEQGCRFGIFTASLPMAVAANGVIPLISGPCDSGIAVNSGVITLYQPGTYLATVTARMGADTAVDSTVTLNVNEASQSSAVIELGGAGPMNSSAQAVFEVVDHALVTLRSADPINVSTSAPQPLFTLSLVRLEE